jgi:capping protein alpha|mmetsp:Transcript_19471/g.27315  ORF Transcript_19471/g.27315 Transcript_19471/m.27315 type:complete len:288 (-) Transcript_19471:230-1093(-)|eukprot:CAMPEP_0175097634 /NCGR_PEP_ID=MMETSP0086_2-20121207/5392_1 /TAXON_ID=136419 /ORGANISM="Unknown Unknown, Strain D1" /LENGTH=287 /DNA_ID=CAMNT_0016371159 /DNA_START=54 /DNA_END=917 /DNA_ORIENTATION=+
MSDGEYEEATPEQKLNIANYFIMSSPSGEVSEVLADVSKLVGDSSVLSADKVEGMLKDYNLEHMTAAKTPAGNKLLVTPYGKVADDLFLDPESGKVLKFNHTSAEFKEETDQKQVLNDDVASYRGAISKAVNSYVSGQFKSDKCTVAVYGSDDGKITICISAINVRLSSFWSGGWRSTFTVDVSTKGTASLSGSSKLNVHYFEDGNVQLHCAREHKESVQIADPDATASSVAKAIGSLESSLQANLEDMYVDMHHTTFKSMRRFMPLTRMPMNWNAAAHSLQSQVGK